MKIILKLAIAAALTLGAAAGAFAQEFTKGTVKKVDSKAKKVTLIHEELKSLDMPAMTMVFVVPDEAMLGKMKEGATVEFVADRVNGKLTVTQVK
ncbi:MAG: copper-binding protein [Alphaproteobacteria bacterium]|uniref:Periplasmic copper binding protein n=1 Tax=Pseudorhizobium halotolerans TaxID=1233081 RepID=A0ABN7JXG3_9HYPH|nr:copper-binding protein [Pseudorhizobium halotolerans]MBU1312811.1 copper-binding protein [Alphaproteobacteria bacterium]MBU1551989.1 copper-binding protein [Alphaproteobacteria bacterium]MBU2337536.1 copper-binding protein [Alphaproteobacteria bacterium]MBU2388177.1 copper-binding protein [Alphaproteobacteria bacterium]CAD7053174.1 periplasmic copper binding protein [Pseudorhizobium halotolerans]